MKWHFVRVVALSMVLGAAAHAAIAVGSLTADMTTTEAVIAPVTTHHRIRIGGREVRYAATFSETLLSDEAGRPQATISCTSYVRERVRDPSIRPVVFLFNGGPGASSSPLHFGAFGPRRQTDQRDAKGVRLLADNPATLLDTADLVFIDPVGTGFSRVRPGGDPGLYWSVEGDSKAALDLIRTWLRDNGRGGSPLYIVGESYGGFRLATMMQYAGDLKIAGLIFISPMLDASAASAAPGNDLPFVFDLPSMAAGAWHHEKIDRAGRTVEQFFEEAARFAQSDYLLALQQGSALSAAERERVAARMSTFIGLPAAMIAATNLRVPSETFLQTLLASEALIVGRLDARITGPRPSAPPKDPNRPAAADDPALGLRGSNVIKSEAIGRHLTRDLQVQTAREYISLTLDVNFRWNWRTEGARPTFYVNPTAHIAELMQKQPQTRVLLLGGYFDLATPVLAPRHALTHANVPLERVSMLAFAAGHSPFEGDENRARVSEAVSEFLRTPRE